MKKHQHFSQLLTTERDTFLHPQYGGLWMGPSSDLAFLVFSSNILLLELHQLFDTSTGVLSWPGMNSDSAWHQLQSLKRARLWAFIDLSAYLLTAQVAVACRDLVRNRNSVCEAPGTRLGHLREWLGAPVFICYQQPTSESAKYTPPILSICCRYFLSDLMN